MLSDPREGVEWRSNALAGFDAPGAEAVAGRAFAAGLATIQRRKMSGPHAKYRVS